MITKRKDKRDLLVLYTHDNKFLEIILKPEYIVDYNKNKGAVDIANGQMKVYKIGRNQVRKYYYKIFLHSNKAIS